MYRLKSIEFRFSDEIPETLEYGVLYISIEYLTAIHLCACGCGSKVVTPLSGYGWTLKFNGKISLTPSIGNWSFACQSHYWISDNEIYWASKFSKEKISQGRSIDRNRKESIKEKDLGKKKKKGR